MTVTGVAASGESLLVKLLRGREGPQADRDSGGAAAAADSESESRVRGSAIELQGRYVLNLGMSFITGIRPRPAPKGHKNEAVSFVDHRLRSKFAVLHADKEEY